MKKKRILLGLTLAGAAFLALASCSKDKDNKKGDASTSEVVSSSEAKSSSSEAKSSSSEAKSSSSEATNTVTVKFGAKFLDGTAARYFDDLEVTVDKGGKVSKPQTDPSVTGYEFLGYYTSATLAVKVDFDTVTYTTNKTIYCAFDKLTDYHTKLDAAADNQYIIAEDFNAGTELDKGDFGAATAGIFDASATGGQVKMNSFAADVIGDGSVRGTLGINFGGVQSTSTIKGYFEFSLASFKKDIFIGIIGAKGSAGKVGEKEFEAGDDFKIVNFGTDDTSNSRIKYDNEVYTLGLTGVGVEAGKYHVFEYEIDTVAKKIKMYLNGEQLELSTATDKAFDYSSIDVTGVKGLQITSLGPSINVSVNNVLVEIQKADATEVKNTALATVNAYKDNAKYTYAKDAIDAIVAKYADDTTGSITLATDADAIAELLNAANAEFAAAIADRKVTVHYMTAESTPLEKDGSSVTSTKDFELGHTFADSDFIMSGYAIKGLYADAALGETATSVVYDNTSDIYVKVETTDLVKTVYDFDYEKISTSDLTTSAKYYVVSSDSTNGATTDPVWGDCYDEAKLTDEILKAAFTAKVDEVTVTKTPIISMIENSTVTYRDGVSGKTALTAENAGNADYIGKYIAKSGKAPSNNPSCIEVKGDSLKFTFIGTGKITLKVSSTSSSNTSWFALKDSSNKLLAGVFDEGKFTVATTTDGSTGSIEGYYEIKGSDLTEITFNITTAGTYTLTTSTKRTLRLGNITVEETA